MSRNINQKLKLYRLGEIMVEKTDDTHYLTMPEIIAELEKYNIPAERKSIYTDLEDLRSIGIEVECIKDGRHHNYHVIGRKFELPELKLLVDAIQSSKFITVKKSNDLIKKLETFCSEHEARQLQRQVFVQNRIKTMNESIYYGVDAIHSAISNNKMIRFQYYTWNARKEMELRHNGAYYTVSPWTLTWDDENYYMVAYDSAEGKIKHFRVDKMIHISECDKDREGKELFKQFNAADYAKKNFGMFGGEEEVVSVDIENSMVGVFIDRFGKEIGIKPLDENHSVVRFHVALSPQFIGWIFALGTSVKVVSPDTVVELIKDEINRLRTQYQD